jgi:hypothetical protein
MQRRGKLKEPQRGGLSASARAIARPIDIPQKNVAFLSLIQMNAA